MSGRNWAKARQRDLAQMARRQVVADREALFDPVVARPIEPTKAELRAETDALVAAYKGPVRRAPMQASLRCRTCGHRGAAKIPLGAKPNFKCSQCGSPFVSWRT